MTSVLWLRRDLRRRDHPALLAARDASDGDLVVAYVIDPSIVSTRKVPVNIELQGTLTLGMTVADFRAPAPADCHTSVAVDLDHARFWDLVTEALVRIGEPGAGDMDNKGNASDVELNEGAQLAAGGVK